MRNKIIFKEFIDGNIKQHIINDDWSRENNNNYFEKT